jgi:alanine racemase
VEILGSHQTYEEIAYETGTNEHEILISLGKNSKKVYI